MMSSACGAERLGLAFAKSDLDPFLGLPLMQALISCPPYAGSLGLDLFTCITSTSEMTAKVF